MDNITVGNVLKNRYEIIAELGKGGMSTVYLAKDLKLESYWAVKRVRNDSSVDIEAFKMEVELLSSLNHSDIPRIVDRIEVDNYYFVIMDFIDGISLKRKVQTEGPQKEGDIVEWVKMLSDILIYLHTTKSNPIIYRDMKPDNIMLTQNGRVKLIDFGIAKECVRNEKQIGIGTKGYAAPEQYGGASNILDERTDIYSLGATIFYLATGERPANPPNGVKPAGSVNPYISEGLEYIIHKCTRDNPDERYNDCYELKDDLNNIAKMTGYYCSRMVKKLLSFGICLAICIISIIFTAVGHNGLEKKKKDNYLYYYNLAVASVRKGDLDSASQQYLKALSYDDSEVGTYIEYFNSILPVDNDEKYDEKLESAINIMRNSYINNSKSEMYMNEQLMYTVAKKCLELTDVGYISYAAEYIKILSEKNYGADDLLSYGIISENLSENFEEIDFESLYKALEELENITDNKAMTIDDKLDNYYNIMKVYSRYPLYLGEQNGKITYSYEKIAEIGEKARLLIDENILAEEIEFKGIIKLHEMVASGLCSKVSYLDDNIEKYNTYKEAMLWFGYLYDYNAELDSTLQLKKANAYMGLYEYADGKNAVRDINNIDYAIDEYKKIALKDDSNFVAKVYLTEALLKKELAVKDREKDYTQVMQNYGLVEELYKTSKDKLSSAEITRYSALKQEMINAGLEVTE
ncbi:MAG: serine/threonine protein kinase [Lachnospiraceae bacterium]|nr:serine/threonine protein kinase [Lachnospiraceae bacterium]